MKSTSPIWLVINLTISIALVRWLVGISWWLDWYLASSMTGQLWLFGLLRESREQVRQIKVLFDINDAELVEASALAHRLEDRVGDLESNVGELVRKVEEGLTRPQRSY